MGLLTILRKNKLKEKEMRILMLGLDNAGKTTIVKKLMNEPIDTVSPTLGFNIKSLNHIGYRLNIWDVGGQKSLRSYWKNYFEQTDGLIWVIDATDRSRIVDCKNELFNLLNQERLQGATLLILANKQDISNALSKEEIELCLGLKDITTHQWTILPCSAVLGNNLTEGLDWIVKDIAKRLYVLD